MNLWPGNYQHKPWCEIGITECTEVERRTHTGHGQRNVLNRLTNSILQDSNKIKINTFDLHLSWNVAGTSNVAATRKLPIGNIEPLLTFTHPVGELFLTSLENFIRCSHESLRAFNSLVIIYTNILGTLILVKRNRTKLWSGRHWQWQSSSNSVKILWI